MEQLRLGLIGAGERGANCYAPYAFKYPTEVRFVCVAEPQKERRASFAKAHGIPEEWQFEDWKEMLEKTPELDGVIVSTQDQQHFEPAMAAIEKGYGILLEKPMAETAEKTKMIVEAAEKKGVPLMVCHVLRHTPYFIAMKEEIEKGTIGDVQSIHHIENIGYWHFAHSYVRGNWHNTKETTPMIVAKCCHDMDIFNFLLGGRKCRKISSFGNLSYFTRENMPQGAAENCMEGCSYNKTCQYSAYKYLEDRTNRDNFRDIIMRTDDREAFLKHLKESPYSRCVYQCDNDAVSRQTVNLEYEGGITVSFQASAFTQEITRQTKIMGTKGEIEGCLEEDSFNIRDFDTGNITKVRVHTPKTLHSGGDEKIMSDFIQILKNPEKGMGAYGAGMSLQGHIMAFAAEESRQLGGKVIEL